MVTKAEVKTMKAMVINSYGDTNVFEYKEMPVPKPKGRELLVQVFSTSVNPVDIKIRKGLVQTGLKPPQILGFDVSGVVVETGEKVVDFKIGDEVYYLPRIIGSQGAYAEYHLVEEEIVARKPSNLSHLEAAAVPLVASTAWDSLVERCKIKLGESILIHAGAGGVGSIAIQLSKLLGLFVIATCRSANFDFVKNLGADILIDYRSQDFVQAVMKETKGEGVDVVFDTIGGENLTKSFDVLRPYGRIASIVRVDANIQPAFAKNISIHPVFVQSGRQKLDIIRDLLERKRLKPVIDSAIQLKDVPKAHEKLEKGGVKGKIVVDLRGQF